MVQSEYLRMSRAAMILDGANSPTASKSEIFAAVSPMLCGLGD